MTASYKDIEGWVTSAAKSGDVRHVIIACDTYDYEKYPVFVRDCDDFWAAFRRASDMGNMQKVDEVYDLSLDITEQLRERRALHCPPRPTGVIPPADLIQHRFRPSAEGRCVYAVPDGDHYRSCEKMRVFHDQTTP